MEIALKIGGDLHFISNAGSLSQAIAYSHHQFCLIYKLFKPYCNIIIFDVTLGSMVTEKGELI